ncbi:MAG: nucleoside monophosphate kinase [Candidatus Moranbacteria bacterium]|nr:nucleoside monophosphate kinase [Candidatus Moranbacteria bacterium]
MNIIILGQAGSGKGTQAGILAKKYGLEHFDTGKLLRQVARLDGELGREIHEIINVRKELVPSRILKEIVHLRLSDMPREQGIVFDGVPRNLEQAGYFSETLKEFGRKIDKVFFVNIPGEESIRRISFRRVCRDCKKVFIMGKDIRKETDRCLDCGGEIMHRIDDTVEGIKKRLQVFEEETMPVVDSYREEGVLVEIDGGQNIEKVANDIAKNVVIR